MALTVLKQGDKVIASSRNPSKTPDLVSAVEKLGGHWIKLDVTSSDAGMQVVSAVQSLHPSASSSGLDLVLVNNAGYSLLGVIEDLSDTECRQQFDTNFFAPLNIARAVLPLMRAQKCGTIVNISSVAGLDGLPSTGLYAASKFALEGASESLAREVEPLGLRVLLVEPGGFRTDFLKEENRKHATRGMNDVYVDGPAGRTTQRFQTMHGKQPGDPAKGAKMIFDVVTGTGVAEGLSPDAKKFLRLPLGKDCAARMEMKADSLSASLHGLESIWSNTDFDA